MSARTFSTMFASTAERLENQRLCEQESPTCAPAETIQPRATPVLRLA
jgi:hypothetical protein